MSNTSETGVSAEATDIATNTHPLIEALSTDRCWELLREQHVGRLAVSANNKPDIFPVNYAIDGQRIYIRTAPGHKLAAAVLGSGVAFEIDAIDSQTETGWSVVVKGIATEVEDLHGYFHAESLEIDPWAGGQKSRVIEIEPATVTGRYIPPT